MSAPVCMRGYCDRPAVTAVHPHQGHPIVRPDHLTEGFVDDWRCLDCALDDVAGALEGVRDVGA